MARASAVKAIVVGSGVARGSTMRPPLELELLELLELELLELELLELELLELEPLELELLELLLAVCVTKKGEGRSGETLVAVA